MCKENTIAIDYHVTNLVQCLTLGCILLTCFLFLQASKLGLLKNKSIVCFFASYQVSLETKDVNRLNALFVVALTFEASFKAFDLNKLKIAIQMKCHMLETLNWQWVNCDYW